jgi:hypothetical protein
MVAAVRNDIFVIDGGMLDVPGPVILHFNIDIFRKRCIPVRTEKITLAREAVSRILLWAILSRGKARMKLPPWERNTSSA